MFVSNTYNIELVPKLSNFLVTIQLEIDAFEGGISMRVRITLPPLKKVMIFTREILPREINSGWILSRLRVEHYSQWRAIEVSRRCPDYLRAV